MNRADYYAAAAAARGDCVDDADRAQRLAEQEVADALAARAYDPPADPQERDPRTGEIICCDCRGPIAPGRLEAIPGAVRCVDCQGVAEREWRR